MTTIANIIAAVAERHQLKPADLTGVERHRSVSHPRHQAYWIARELTGKTYPEIAAATNRSDHAGIIHGCRQHAERMKRDDTLRISTAEIIGQLRGVDPWIEAVPFRTRRNKNLATFSQEAA